MRKRERKYLRSLRLSSIKDDFGSAKTNEVDFNEAFCDKTPKMAEEGLKVVNKRKKKLRSLRNGTHKKTVSTLE